MCQGMRMAALTQVTDIIVPNINKTENEDTHRTGLHQADYNASNNGGMVRWREQEGH